VNAVKVTYLEMRSPADLRPKRSAPSGFVVEELAVKQWQFNRFLYAFVGEQWSWTDKLVWSEHQWQSYVESPGLRTFVAREQGSLAGYYELCSDLGGGIEVAIFGLTPHFVGKGLGGILLTHALEEAWKLQPRRVWLHTCTLDHPSALHNYVARGLKIYKEQFQPAPRV